MSLSTVQAILRNAIGARFVLRRFCFGFCDLSIECYVVLRPKIVPQITQTALRTITISFNCCDEQRTITCNEFLCAKECTAKNVNRGPLSLVADAKMWLNCCRRRRRNGSTRTFFSFISLHSFAASLRQSFVNNGNDNANGFHSNETPKAPGNAKQRERKREGETKSCYLSVYVPRTSCSCALT